MLAAEKGHAAIVKKLLSASANVGLQDMVSSSDDPYSKYIYKCMKHVCSMPLQVKLFVISK